MSHKSLAAILNISDPKALSDLQQRYPGLAADFTPTREFGARGEADEPGTATDADTNATRDFVIASLGPLREQYDRLLQDIRIKASRANLIKRVGAIVALVSGAVAAWASLYLSEGHVAAISATVGSVGSGCSLLADQVIRTESGTLIASPEKQAEYVGMRVEIEKFAQLMARPRGVVEPGALSAAMDRLDELARELIRARFA